MSNLYKQSFKQNYTENVSLSIFNCGIQRCEGGYTWGPGIRDHYLIHMILKGKGSYCVSGKEYTLKQGDLFLAKPNQLITYTADQNDPWEYAWVGFNGACANRLVSQLPFWENAPVHHCANFDKVSFELLQIFENRGSSSVNETAMIGHLYLFIAHLTQEALAQNPRSNTSSAQYVHGAIKFIQFNYFHDISISDCFFHNYP